MPTFQQAGTRLAIAVDPLRVVLGPVTAGPVMAKISSETALIEHPSVTIQEMR